MCVNKDLRPERRNFCGGLFFVNVDCKGCESLSPHPNKFALAAGRQEQHAAKASPPHALAGLGKAGTDFPSYLSQERAPALALLLGEGGEIGPSLPPSGRSMREEGLSRSSLLGNHGGWVCTLHPHTPLRGLDLHIYPRLYMLI